MDAKYPVHMICCTWKITLFSEQARPYLYRRSPRSASPSSAMRYSGGILVSQEHRNDPLHICNLSALERSEVLTRPVLAIPKEEPEKHSFLVRNCLPCSVTVDNESFSGFWLIVCLLLQFGETVLETKYSTSHSMYAFKSSVKQDHDVVTSNFVFC